MEFFFKFFLVLAGDEVMLAINVIEREFGEDTGDPESQEEKVQGSRASENYFAHCCDLLANLLPHKIPLLQETL
jgi:hypothetical protein